VPARSSPSVRVSGASSEPSVDAGLSAVRRVAPQPKSSGGGCYEEVTRALDAREAGILTSLSKRAPDDRELERSSPSAAGAPQNELSGLTEGVTVVYRSPPKEITKRSAHGSSSLQMPAVADTDSKTPPTSVRTSKRSKAFAETVRPGRERKALAETESTAPPAGRRTAAIVGVFMVVLLGAAGFVLSAPAGIRVVAQGWARLTDSLSSLSAPDKPAIPPSAPPSAIITLAISVTPPEARVYLDGEPIANPTEIDRPRDKLRHELRAEADGYSALDHQIRFERDLTVSLDLAPTPSDANPSR